MKKLYFFTVCFYLFLQVMQVSSQDYPMLGHTLINSVLYNPSLAGADMDAKGSIMLIRQECMSAINGHPTLTLLSGNMPFKNYRIGIGGNLLVEQVNFLQQIRGNADFSYHLIFNHVNRLSFGLSTDLSYLTIDENEVIAMDPTLIDPVLLEYEDGKLYLDFSYGMNYHSQVVACGVTVNNLKGIALQSNENVQKGYYSGYLKFYIPVNFQRDMLEPVITVRKLPLSSPIASFGVSYAYRKVNTLGTMRDGFITGGLSFDTNLSFGISMNIKLLKRLRLGYNYQTSGRYYNLLGSTHEIVLRFNYLNLTYNEKTNEYFKWNNRKYVFRRKLKN